ncbi:MAG: YkgJ family cysteine cluster protein [Congregibacter sp.]|nr:YkgJ family cysteine cluster protein [Congregibacter sp.]
MICRKKCGACCSAASISSPLPGMPEGKPAGVVCVNLSPLDFSCGIWGTASYPQVCRQFQARPDSCGSSRSEAIKLISLMETATA